MSFLSSIPKLAKWGIGLGTAAVVGPQVFNKQPQETSGALPQTPTLPQETLWQRQQQIHPYVQKHVQFTAQVANFLSNWIRQEKPTIYEIKAVMESISPLLEFSKNMAANAVQVAHPQAYERVNMMNNLLSSDNQAIGLAPQTNQQNDTRNQALQFVYGLQPKPNGLTQQLQPNPTQQQVPTDALDIARKYQLLNQALE